MTAVPPPSRGLDRSMMLAGAGALAGLVLAGFALFTARGVSTLIVPADDVALVNQQPINRSDYNAALQAIYQVGLAQATRAQRRRVLDDMIREELFVQRGRELDVASNDPAVRSAMVSSVEQEIAADAITARPAERALRAYYLAHRSHYANEGTMLLRDLVFDAASAESAAQALRTGQPPEAVLAKFKGHDSGRLSGEEFYFAAKIHLGESLFRVAQALGNGAVSAPVAAGDGVHVLVMVRNAAPEPPAFDDVRSRVLADMQAEAIARLERGESAFLRERANVLIAPDLR